MLSHPNTLRRRPVSPPNPDDLMSGKCATCGNSVTVLRREAVPPISSRHYLSDAKEPGAWDDLYFTECPTCKARSPENVNSGTKVFLTKIAKLATPCQTSDYGQPCRRDARWSITANRFVEPHLCCDNHKRLWESLRVSGFSAKHIENPSTP